MPVIEISSDEQLKQAQEGKSVLFFWASWHEPSKRGGQLQDIYKTLQQKYEKINFFLIEAESVPSLSEKMGVEVVPTFFTCVGSSVHEKLEGANPSDLSNLVKKLANLTESEIQAKMEMDQQISKEEITKRLEKLINAAPIMLFMKGSPGQPRCGFSRQIVEILQNDKIPFASFDILTDEEVRQGLKEYSDWPTYPQLYANGSLVGGLDIVKEMVASGSLRDQLNVDKILESYRVEPVVDRDDSTNSKRSLTERLKELTHSAPIMLFMKGSPSQPRCGFSSQIVELLKEQHLSFGSFDILTDEEVRQGLKEYSDWPTYPQLYVNGSLVGGLDIVKEMVASGNLKEQLGLA